MTRSLLSDAFSHHAWATLRLLDACSGLDAGQLQTEVPGTYGPIIETLRHLIGADASYLFALTGGLVPRVDETEMSVPALRTVAERNREAWTELLATELNPDAVVVRRRDDGSETHAPMGIRLAQALHHGSDHRSQICTALTSIGVEPPEIDVWDFAAIQGRLREIPPSS